MLKATKKDSYINDAGKRVFVYRVSGTEQDLEDFKAAQGDNYREDDDGTPLFFTAFFVGERCPMGISQKSGKVYMDTSEYDEARALVESQGGNLGEAMAQQMAAKLLGGSSTRKSAVVEKAAEIEETEEVEKDDLGKA